MKFWIALLGLIILVGIGGTFIFPGKKAVAPVRKLVVKPTPTPTSILGELSINSLKSKSYIGSVIKIEQTIGTGSNYDEYVTSYMSDGLKIYALLTVPRDNMPKEGWPVILLNHGYITPSTYSTTDSYSGIVRYFAQHEYIVFKPDYRGNGNSAGSASQVYISSGYIDDSLNALSSLKKYPGVNPNKIGVWGHSMGGNITLHDLVISKDFKAAVLWSGVVGDYSQILSWWQQRIANKSIVGNDLQTSKVIEDFINTYGTPSANPTFWNAIDPTNYILSINAPVQIDVGTGDTTVPPVFSTDLAAKLQRIGKSVELFIYPGADHNLAPQDALALQRSLSFFDKYLK